jgi:hypothetical protein
MLYDKFTGKPALHHIVDCLARVSMTVQDLIQCGTRFGKVK